ncbi:EthD family reductase [Nakamurella leprariae]|uniref:EthD family reductase n=1 Tax=Nakamurella leprariae TaxID=2803911 RepID=A0A939BVQ5_9ACTN|nr:EthD family reductase [Nakamurella leprariae]MBM9466763.1 EthD family reductase [Nakamurella leprariae]
MFQVTVSYGFPVDPSAFDRYYEDVHLPLATTIPNVRSLVASRCESWGGAEAQAYFQVTLTFDSREAAQQAFQSDQGQAATADIPQLATGGFTVTAATVEPTLTIPTAAPEPDDAGLPTQPVDRDVPARTEQAG